MTEISLPEPVIEYLVKLDAHMQGRMVNGYLCSQCRKTLITTHVHPGVTPIGIECRMTKGCPGIAYSLNYPEGPVPEELGPPTWEWYRPEQEEYDTLATFMKEHVMQGGLMLREIGGKSGPDQALP